VLALPLAFGVVCLVLLRILIGRFATCFPALSGALDWCLCRCPGPQSTYRGACLAGVLAWARPTSASAGAQLASQRLAAGEPGPALCLAQALRLAGVAWLGVGFGHGQRPSRRRNARQPENRHRPQGPPQQPNCGWCWHFALSVLGYLLFIGRVYKHGASIYETRTGTRMCRSAHKTRTRTTGRRTT
jgi:hypothetical protein